MPFDPRIVRCDDGAWESGEAMDCDHAFASPELEAPELEALGEQLEADAARLQTLYPPVAPDAARITAETTTGRWPSRFAWAAACALLLAVGLGFAGAVGRWPGAAASSPTAKSAPAPSAAGTSIPANATLAQSAPSSSENPAASKRNRPVLANRRSAPGSGSLAAAQVIPPSVQEMIESNALLLEYMELDASVRDAFDDLEQDGKLKRVPLSF
ncbi:MAG: hypothetical protein N2C14_31760 [Planctomycetales bacterium]